MTWRLESSTYRVESYDAQRIQGEGKKLKAQVCELHEVNDQEFWSFWGLIVVTSHEGRKVGRLWDRHEPEGNGAKVDVSAHVKEHHFVNIKRLCLTYFLTQTRR